MKEQTLLLQYMYIARAWHLNLLPFTLQSNILGKFSKCCQRVVQIFRIFRSFIYCLPASLQLFLAKIWPFCFVFWVILPSVICSIVTEGQLQIYTQIMLTFWMILYLGPFVNYCIVDITGIQMPMMMKNMSEKQNSCLLRRSKFSLHRTQSDFAINNKFTQLFIVDMTSFFAQIAKIERS